MPINLQAFASGGSDSYTYERVFEDGDVDGNICEGNFLVT
jgi:hypothetical protein